MTEVDLHAHNVAAGPTLAQVGRQHGNQIGDWQVAEFLDRLPESGSRVVDGQPRYRFKLMCRPPVPV